MKKLLLLITLVVVTIAFAVPGQAATYQLNIDTVFSDKPNPAGIAPWITVVFDDGGTAGSVDMRISGNLQDADEFLSELYLNSDSVPADTVFTLTDSSGGFTLPTIYTGINSQKADGDGLFDIRLNFSTSEDDTFNNYEWLEYAITANGLTANSFDLWSAPDGGEGAYLAAAHIQGIGEHGEDSTWVGAVPIPASVFLLGSGLIGLVGFRRKKIAK